jgi:hypothetical protein
MDLRSAMEEKIEELNGKLARSIAERIVFTAADVASIAEIVKFITFSIEVTMVSLIFRMNIYYLY